MLKQILQDMRIEPEILNGLTDSEKQTLFCIMREEQIKRWRDWDQQKSESEKNQHNEDTYNSVNLSQSTKRPKKLKKYSVEFLLGADGEPWVWVMGEHENDRTIDQILANEAQHRARELAEQEAKELRKSVEAELTDIIEYNHHNKQNSHNGSAIAEEKRPPKKLDDDDEGHTPIIDDLEIYCSVDELRERMNVSSGGGGGLGGNQNGTNSQSRLVMNGSPKISNRIVTTISKANKADHHQCNVLQEISTNKPANNHVAKNNTQKVAARVALWEQRLIAERSTEILRGIQRKQEEKVKEAEEAAKSCEFMWKEQERKAKEAELKMREIARRAREEHRKSLNCDQLEVGPTGEITQKQQQQRPRTVILEKSHHHDHDQQAPPPPPASLSPPTSLEGTVARPPNPEAVLRWYRDSEMVKGAGRESGSGKPAKWFHGLLSRAAAEALLGEGGADAQGSFLVRISEKIWGYAISYKDGERCKHYLVDASSPAGHYKFLGSNQIAHSSLEDLIKYHATTPITASGNELLTKAVAHHRSWEEILTK